jgi:hypothetical protein
MQWRGRGAIWISLWLDLKCKKPTTGRWWAFVISGATCHQTSGFRLAAALCRAVAFDLNYAGWVLRKACSNASKYHCVYEQKTISAKRIGFVQPTMLDGSVGP